MKLLHHWRAWIPAFVASTMLAVYTFELAPTFVGSSN